MVATPSSAAIRRIDRPVRPSASATATAARTTRSRLSSASASRRRADVAAGRAGLAGSGVPASGLAGSAIPGSATTVPVPGTGRASPARCSAASTFVAVAMATPHSRVIWRADGSRSPGRSRPDAIRDPISSAIRRYRASPRVTSAPAIRRLLAAHPSY